MRRALATLLVLGATAGPVAARSLGIERFDAAVTVTREGDVFVRETIQARFTGAWNGIWRAIPVEYRTPQGFGYRLLLETTGVTDERGTALRYEIGRERHYLKLRIWVPGARDATRTVVIAYRVRNALKFFADHDELYWNVTGDEWEVPIEAAAARIRFPAGASGLRALAFTGSYGSRARDADVAVDGGEVTVRMRRPLAFREGLTVVVGWDKGAVAEPSALERGLLFLRANWPLGAPLAALAAMLALWWRRGRDPRLRPVAVRYEPPEGLTPAEVGTLADNAADVRDVTATLVDLAVRGFLLIEEHEEPGLLWASRFYVLRRVRPPSEWESLKPHEFVLLEGVFEDGREEASLADLENRFYRRLPRVREGILNGLVGRGCYVRRPDRVRLAYRIGAGVVVGLGLIAAAWGDGRIAAASGTAPLAFVVGGLLSGAIVFGFAWIMPARTARGARALEEILGFEEFLTRVEGDRLARLAKTPELFETCLPYAMALGVERAWARAFEGICREPPRWYRSGSRTDFAPRLFVDRLGGMSRAAAAAMVSQPRGTGGSGFGGGGSSGGGFGGGGGGGF